MTHLESSKKRLKEYKRMAKNIELLQLAIHRSIATEQLNINKLKEQLKKQNN